MDEPRACVRHPDRPAVTVCARCGRPSCIEDLVEAPVGYQCVDCTRDAAPVRRLGDPVPTPTVTRALVGLIVLVALLGTTGAVDIRTFGLVPVLVGSGEWWRLLTSALLHGGLFHLAFNGLLLWRLGQLLEPRLGGPTFLGLVVSGTAGGGLGVVALSWLVVATPIGTIPAAATLLGAGPFSVTVGASGAVFGLMGAVLVLLRRRGLDPWATAEGSTVGGLVVLNLILTFVIPSISVGGHVGGLLGGAAAALTIRSPVWAVGGAGTAVDRDRTARGDATRTGAVALTLVVAASLLAGGLLRALGG